MSERKEALLNRYKEKMDKIASIVREKRVADIADLMLELGYSYSHIYHLIKMMKKLPDYKDIEIRRGLLIKKD